MTMWAFILSMVAVVGLAHGVEVSTEAVVNNFSKENYTKTLVNLQQCAVPSEKLFQRPVGSDGTLISSQFDSFCFYKAGKEKVALYMCEYYKVIVELSFKDYCETKDQPLDTFAQYTKFLDPQKPCEVLVELLAYRDNTKVFSSGSECTMLCYNNQFCGDFAFILEIFINSSKGDTDTNAVPIAGDPGDISGGEHNQVPMDTGDTEDDGQGDGNVPKQTDEDDDGSPGDGNDIAPQEGAIGDDDPDETIEGQGKFAPFAGTDEDEGNFSPIQENDDDSADQDVNNTVDQDTRNITLTDPAVPFAFDEDSQDSSESYDVSDLQKGSDSESDIMDNTNLEDKEPSDDLNQQVAAPAGLSQEVNLQDNEAYKILLEEGASSHFLAYSLTAIILIMVTYILYHNKQKIVAIIIEGRNGGQGKRRRYNQNVIFTTLDEVA